MLRQKAKIKKKMTIKATRVLSSGGGGGEASPPKCSASPPKPFAIINSLILKCVILSKILVECYMNVHACVLPKPKFLEPWQH